MDKFVIQGIRELSGTVKISGSKNAALPIMAASILAQEPCEIHNVPNLSDIRTMCEVLEALGVDAKLGVDGVVRTKCVDDSLHFAPWKLVKKMRASICVLGPLLAARGKAIVSYPGGCSIGTRPIDIHLKGLSALGVKFKTEHGNLIGECEKLVGAEIYLGGHFGSSVLATANVVSAAVLAEGETYISHAACEPEIVDLADMLNAMGAKIKGAGSSRIEITGVSKLSGCTHRVIPDRIETLTFIVAGAITKSPIRVEGGYLSHLNAFTDRLEACGVRIKKDGDAMVVVPPDQILPTEITTLPYPGFPTDGQAQIISMLAVASGTSFVTEKVFPDRFMHVAELNRLGADIRRAGPTAVVNGVKKLSGAEIMASDLRASAALVLAGLVAEGQTELHRVYHIDRGYERIEEKLNGLGASIVRVNA